jgi:tripartite-type tricarboxylate transporter receptor subunit TctC
MKAAWLIVSLYCAITGMAAAQSDPAPGFPSKPIRWIVGFAPGASNDLIARTVAQRLTEIWGRQIIIDNRPGAVEVERDGHNTRPEIEGISR